MSSSESELEMLQIILDSSDSDSEENIHRVRVYKQRVNYLTTLDDFEFQLRFRLVIPSVQELLLEIYSYLRITGARNHGVAPIHQLLLTLRLSLIRANAVIVATAVFHNICRIKSLNDIPPEVEIPDGDAVPVPNNNEANNQTIRETLT